MVWLRRGLRGKKLGEAVASSQLHWLVAIAAPRAPTNCLCRARARGGGGRLRACSLSHGGLQCRMRWRRWCGLGVG
eukprot:COSAG01_NODE_2090_length_8453_cov_554.144721_5_plen_76_part_00